jgi:hypothetical protein
MTESDYSFRQCTKKQIQEIGAMDVISLIISRKRRRSGPYGSGDRLALRSAQHDAADRRTDLLQLVLETDASQQSGRIRMDGDPGADLPQHLGLFEDADIEASRSKRERGSQASNAATDYCNAKGARHFHVPLLLSRNHGSGDVPERGCRRGNPRDILADTP